MNILLHVIRGHRIWYNSRRSRLVYSAAYLYADRPDMVGISPIKNQMSRYFR